MTNSTTSAITAAGLRESYGEQLVLDGVDLTVARGTVYALLGPNGAGKTTAVHVLSTLLAADGGTLTVAGHDVVREADEVRKSIGLTGQFSAVDNLLSGAENLQLMADLHHLDKAKGKRRAAELLARVDLTDADKLPMTYSGGMKRKLDLAMTLMGDPEVIFLDEPTTGLDPRTRRAMWDAIRALVAGGVTILLTTQYLEEADQLADKIGLLDHGKIIAEGTSDELKRLIPGGHVSLRFSDPSAYDTAARSFAEASRDDENLVLQVPGDGDLASLRAVMKHLDAHGIEAADLTIHTPDLDDVFLALTGRPAETPDTDDAGNSTKETVR
jgi:ABC-2 type transport system ATP-binding protein